MVQVTQRRGLAGSRISSVFGVGGLRLVREDGGGTPGYGTAGNGGNGPGFRRSGRSSDKFMGP